MLNTKTCKNNTYEALNSYYLNTQTMRINQGYLNDNLCIFLVNDRNLYFDGVLNRRRKVESVVWEAFTQLANECLKMLDYSTICNSKQLKDWLFEYGEGYNTLQESIDYVVEYRQEHFSEQ